MQVRCLWWRQAESLSPTNKVYAWSISFAAPNSNVEADGTSIYTERETLYVTSPTANTAKVYNVSGVLVRTLTLSAGETVRTALPAGFYVVALGNGNTHKVIVK